jgi:hypothetical protein
MFPLSCARPRSGCRTPAHESLEHLCWFSIQSIWINKNKIGKSKLQFFCYFWELINLMSVMDLFWKLLPLPPGLPKPTQLLLRRHHGLRTCIPGLEGTLAAYIPHLTTFLPNSFVWVFSHSRGSWVGHLWQVSGKHWERGCGDTLVW